MGQIVISGNLVGGPPAGSSSFPTAQFSASLALSSNPKQFQYATGVLTRVLSDAATFVELGAVGTGKDVPAANFLYIKVNGDFQLRLTQDDGAGGSDVRTTQHRGLFIAEFPDTRKLLKVEIAASATLEYAASGPA